MPISREAWVSDKISLAKCLARGQNGGGYAEAMIVLSSVVNALASEMWPGKGIDQKRYVEAMVLHSDPSLHASRISIPMLLEWLRSRGEPYREALTRISRRYLGKFDPTRVLSGDDVDCCDLELASALPSLEPCKVRKFSYASIFYREVRSAYVHQYQTGERVNTWTLAADTPNVVSYGNWRGGQDKHIHFPVAWQSAVALSMAKAADAMSESFPLSVPSRWWLEEDPAHS